MESKPARKIRLKYLWLKLSQNTHFDEALNYQHSKKQEINAFVLRQNYH